MEKREKKRTDHELTIDELRIKIEAEAGILTEKILKENIFDHKNIIDDRLKENLRGLIATLILIFVIALLFVQFREAYSIIYPPLVIITFVALIRLYRVNNEIKKNSGDHDELIALLNKKLELVPHRLDLTENTGEEDLNNPTESNEFLRKRLHNK